MGHRGDIAGVGAIGRYLPGAAGKAISGQTATSLLSTTAGAAVLFAYAVAAIAMGSIAVDRTDFA